MSTICITVDADLQEKFDIALKLTGEEKNSVFEAFMRRYIAQSFSDIAESYTAAKHGEHPAASNEADSYGKALHRIPKWASKPHQINYKILRAFLQLQRENGRVTYEALLGRCSDRTKHPDVFVPTFATNFAQMKFDGGKSHGKVFDVDANGQVTIWSYVQRAVLENQDKFLTSEV